MRFSPGPTSLLAWSLAGLSVTTFLATVALFVLARSAHVPSGLSAGRTVVDLLISVPLLAFPLVGAMIASRLPRKPDKVGVQFGKQPLFVFFAEERGLKGVLRHLAAVSLGEPQPVSDRQ